MTRIFTRCALTSLTILGATFAGGVLARADDVRQLAAGAGLSQSEAAGMTLTEIAAAKFNRDSGGDDQQTISHATPVRVDPARHARLVAAAGLTPAEAQGMTLTQLAAGVFNAGSDGDDAQTVVSVSSRGPVRIGSQLVAAAGLDPVEAQGMSLTEIAAAKFGRDTGND